MSDTPVSSALHGDAAPATPEAAQSALESLQGNAEWSEKFLSGDPAAAAKFHELSRIIVGAGPAAKEPTSAAPKTADEARSTLAALQNDSTWAARFLRGEAKEREQFAALNYFAVNGVPPAGPNISVLGMSSPRHILSAADALAQLGFPMRAISEAVGGIPDLAPEHIAKANELHRQVTGDPEWRKRYLAGGYAERQLMTAISVVRSQWETKMRDVAAR
ncbi:MAG: hypothetical protein U1E81_16090 [Xanthobacteraceae bacterium]